MKVHKRTSSLPNRSLGPNLFSDFTGSKSKDQYQSKSKKQMEDLYKSLSEYIQKYGEIHTKVYQLRNAIGSLHFRRGDFISAEIEYSKALKSVRENISDELSLASTLGNLGTLHWNIGKYKSSISYLEEALEINRKLYGGSDMNVKVADALHNLGLVRFLDKDFERGQVVLEKALSIRKDIHGEFHVDVARTLDVLGKVYLAKNLFSLASNSHREALEIKNKVLGKMSPSSLISLINIANVYRCEGKFDQAIELYREAFEMQLRVATNDEKMLIEAGTTLHIIGDAQVQKTSYFGALSSYRGAESIFDQAGLNSNDDRVSALHRSVNRAQKLLKSSGLFLIREKSHDNAHMT